ncbi:nuclear pore complex subunit [Coemansia sp. RSA 552]|nr:nuclear pore complex subunit [Coemansia sp. RSA 552]
MPQQQQQQQQQQQGLSLSSLLEESKRLTTHLSAGAGSEIPAVQRGLDLLESESRKLVARSVREGGHKFVDPRAQSLLASTGVDADHLADSRASAALMSAFEMLQPGSVDANVESYLSQRQELSIVGAIEESELSTLDDFDRGMEAHMMQVWEESQRRLFEELGQYQGAASGPSDLSAMPVGPSTAAGASAFDLSDSRVTQPRVERYSQVVRDLNQARVAEKPFDLLARLEKATAESSQELKSKQIGQVWSLLAHFARAKESGDAAVVKGACAYLEETFVEHLERIVAQYPHDANVGGIPSVHRKVQGFLNVQFGRLGRVPAFLEVFNGEAIWAHMYTLYRCGYKQELLKYALEMEDIITDSDPGFVAHLKAFFDKAAGTIRGDVPVTAASLEDPYKAALYRVVGRGNVPKKAAAEVVQTTEDYLWSALAVIRDGDMVAASSGGNRGRDTLAQLQQLMLKFGPTHFDPNGTNPLLYLRVLLLCGAFENACDYLLQIDRFQVEAVHLGVALASMGLLRVPSGADNSMGSFSSYLVEEADQKPALDFSRVVVHYARALSETRTDDAVNYLLLLILPGLSTDIVRQRTVCEQALVRLLYERCSEDYAHYLGDIQSDGTRKCGYLEHLLPLLGITTTEQFSQTIIRRLADRSRDEGRLADTVLLYNLGERYNTVLNVLCKQLGELLYVRAGNLNDTAAISGSGDLDDVEGVSRAVLMHYKQREHIARVLDEQAVSTCQTLLSIMDFLNSHRRGAFEEALEIIEGTQLLPLGGDVSEAAQSAERVRGLDDSITRNFSVILLAAMDTVSRLYAGLKESPFLDAIKQANMQTLRRKARSLMVFAGMIQFRMPSDTYAKLNRMDVFMS